MAAVAPVIGGGQRRRNGYHVVYEPTPENIGVFFREVDETEEMLEIMPRADHDQEPRELKANHDNGPRDIDAIFRTLDAILQPRHNQEPRQVRANHGNGPRDIDAIFRALGTILQPREAR